MEDQRNASVSVGTASTLLAEEQYGQQRRTLISITNTSTAGQIITLSFDKEAVAGQGIPIYPSGAWSEAEDAVFKPCQKRIFAISDAANGTVAIQERVKS